MESFKYDILVIGAGAAGLMASLELARAGKTVAIVEAKAQAGGRIASVVENGYTMELGAEFVHGELPLTKMILQKAGAKTYRNEGSIWQHKDGRLQRQEDFIEDGGVLAKKLKSLREDKTVAAFLQDDLAGEKYKDLRHSISNYVEGYYAADVTKASARAFSKEWINGDDGQYQVDGSYRVIIEWLEEECREGGVQFFLSEEVAEVQWQKDLVTVVTKKSSFFAKTAVVTVSIGVLQQGRILFSPALPEINQCLAKLGFGHVLKTVMRFRDPFWKEEQFTEGQDLSDLGFLFSEEEIPTWWTRFPRNEALLTGWLGGSPAEELQPLAAEQLKEKAIHSLSHLFDVSEADLRQNLQGLYFHNWSADPHFCGAYSYEVVGGEEIIQKMQQSVERTLYFAGEGLHAGPEIGTVEGALQNGRAAAGRLLTDFLA